MNTPKKIAFAITKSTWGGAQRYVFDIATSLPKADFDPLVIVGGDGLLKQRLDDAGIRTLSLGSLGRDVNASKDASSFISLYRLLKSEKPDIVHLNSSKIGALGALAGRLAGVPRIIFTAHGWAFNEPRSLLQKVLIKIAHWITLILSHKTIVVSDAMREQVSAFPFVGGKISVIHNGIAPFETLPRDEARAQLSLGEVSVPVIGCIAELHRIKGLDVLLDAAVLLKKKQHDFRIVIVGEGEERASLERQIHAEGLEKNVFMPGFVPDAAPCLSAFDIFTLPSRSEAFALALLEAGMAGLPIVATRVGGIPEIVEDGVSGILVAPEHPDALADALAGLLKDSTLRDRLADNLKSHVEHNFSKEKIIQKTLEIYGTK